MLEVPEIPGLDLNNITQVMAASRMIPIGLHSAGGKVSIPLPEDVVGGGMFLHQEIYRPVLWRCWDGTDGGYWGSGAKDYLLSIGMNPSTADATHCCPTTFKDLKFTRRLTPYRRMIKANIADYRATHPAQLAATRNNLSPRSPWNLPLLRTMAREAGMVVVCWGNLRPELKAIGAETIQVLLDDGIDLMCFGLNWVTGQPKHPLYLPDDSTLIAYDEAWDARADKLGMF